MKRLHIWLFAVTAIAMLSLPAKAQRYLGYANSNYAGVHGMLLQPASIVDMRYKVDINLISLHTTFTNNYISLRAKDLRKNFDENADFQQTYLREHQKDVNKFIYMNVDVMGPAVAFNINRKNSIGLHTRFRTVFNFDNVTPELAKLAWEGLEYEDLWRTRLNNESFSAQFMAWNEYGITYGREIIQIKNHYLKGALTLKVIQGLGAAYLYADDLSYNFTNDDTLSLFNSNIDYGHSTNFEFNTESFQYKFISNPTVGFDMGFVYEWRKDANEYTYDMDGIEGLTRRDKNKYKLKVGMSILDIGRVKFTKGDVSGNFVANIENYDISDFSVGSVEEFNDTLEKLFGFTETAGQDFSMNLPTALSFQVDYNIWRGFYANFTSYVSFLRRNDPSKIRQQSNFSITPRYEHKWFDVALPFMVNTDRQYQMGLSMRLAVFVFGTDNIIAPFRNDVYGTDFYFGMKIPIPYGKPKDKDKDGVSNRKDNCKDNPGTWENLGCPDTDGDGLLDNEDLCPNEAGPKENSGCPYADRDKDGVFDKDDECIDVPGPVENKGCPITDKDGDGVLDKDDDCIDVPGLPENNGCPEADKDGDGILDKEDACIDVPGPIENKGCPWPDTDGDGLLDKDDECPRTPGPAENNGCPVVEKEEQDIIDMAFDNLEFETGKTIIKTKSYPYMYNLADLLAKNPEWKLRIAGHTDNVGSDVSNLKLSKERAEAVAKVFMDRGIDKSRLIIEYYGEGQPIDTNDTPEGRAKNRRVEMEITFD